MLDQECIDQGDEAGLACKAGADYMTPAIIRRAVHAARLARSRRRRNHYLRLLVRAYGHPESTAYETSDDSHEIEVSFRERPLRRFQCDRSRLAAAVLVRMLGHNRPDDALEVRSRLHGITRAESPLSQCFRQLLLPRTIDESHASVESEVVGAYEAWRENPIPFLEFVLNTLFEEGTVPRFYEVDHVGDISEIVAARYSSPHEPASEYSKIVASTLSCLVTDREAPLSEITTEIRTQLSNPNAYAPKRGNVTPFVRETIPDLVDEFVKLKGREQPARFLDINREYSGRQQRKQGKWDNRDLSLLRGYERDHLRLFRELMALRRSGAIDEKDEVLVIGPRHIDEIYFFRKYMGLPKTIGLDLFGSPDGKILEGDMHDMEFADGTFKLVFTAGTISYAYDARRVAEEICRVTQKPGFAFIMDAAGRVAGPDPLGRSDLVNADVMLDIFHRHPRSILVRDHGKSLAPHMYRRNPCVALRLL